MALSVEERLDIQQLIAFYGHLVDAADFQRLSEIFTEDAVFDLSGFDGTRYEGLPAIVAMMEASEQHPLAHHATNIVVQDSEPVTVLSKGIGVGAGGRVGSVIYRDTLRRTAAGWRILVRSCDLRRGAEAE